MKKGTDTIHEGVDKFHETESVFQEITEMIREVSIHFSSVESNVENNKTGTLDLEKMMRSIEENSKLNTGSTHNIAKSVANTFTVK